MSTENAQNVIITLVKKHVVFWRRAITVTVPGVLQEVFPTPPLFFPSVTLEARKKTCIEKTTRTHSPQDAYNFLWSLLLFSYSFIQILLMALISTSIATLSIVGAVQKGKETKHYLEISNSPPTKHFKVKSNQPAGCENLYSWLLASYKVCFIRPGWSEGTEDQQNFYLDNKQSKIYREAECYFLDHSYRRKRRALGTETLLHICSRSSRLQGRSPWQLQ